MEKLLKVLAFTPHQKQTEVLHKVRRFTTLICGRRWGKSKLAAFIGFYNLLFPNKYIWIVAPTYSLTEKVWRIIRGWAMGKWGRGWCRVTDSERRITTRWGSTLECKSADNPDSLVGEGLDLLIIDEAARIKDIVWQEALRPTLTITAGSKGGKGSAFIITTPRGKNWVKNIYALGNSTDKENIEYISFKFPTSTNPFIDPKEIEEAKRTLPATVFEQEYNAEFINDAGSVFRNIRGCAIAQLAEPTANIEYVMGIDLAKYEDFTVMFVARKDTRAVVYHERFNQISWALQKERVTRVAKLYNNARIVMDTTAIGDVIYEDLKNQGLNIKRYDFTHATKNVLIENLIAALDQRTIIYPPITELIDELENFEFTMTKAKNIIYNAPDGLHDDEVIALALVNEALNTKSSSFAFL